MALTRFLLPTCLVLLSLLLINVSATDYGYGPKPPQVEQPKPPQVQKPKPPQVEKPTPPQVSTNDYGYGPKPPQVEKPKLDQLYGELLPHNLFGIQGLVLCNSGLKAFPIQGAVARITCVGEDENGYETAPFSILSGATDAKGYFFATLSPSKLEGNYNNKWKLTECKTFLDNSPLESCKVPTDVNHGISGAPIASYRTLNAKNMKLFSVGPFFYSSEPKPAPSGY
ncbi:proline-rich protein 3 [Rosa sericea]